MCGLRSMLGRLGQRVSTSLTKKEARFHHNSTNFSLYTPSQACFPDWDLLISTDIHCSDPAAFRHGDRAVTRGFSSDLRKVRMKDQKERVSCSCVGLASLKLTNCIRSCVHLKSIVTKSLITSHPVGENNIAEESATQRRVCRRNHRSFQPSNQSVHPPIDKEDSPSSSQIDQSTRQLSLANLTTNPTTSQQQQPTRQHPHPARAVQSPQQRRNRSCQ